MILTGDFCVALALEILIYYNQTVPELVEGPSFELCRGAKEILKCPALIIEDNKMKAYVYILLCADGSYYTGSTTNLDIRLAQHFSGEGANYTQKHRPIKLLYFEEFSDISKAFDREKQIQGWSRRKKEALINENYSDLFEFSKK